MPRHIYIVDPGAEVTPDVLAAARAANCPEIMQGVAPSLGLDPATRGAVEIPDPPVVAPSRTAEQKLADARTALAAVATIETPVLTADVFDVLTDLAAALED